jgi:hypothetical protein
MYLKTLLWNWRNVQSYLLPPRAPVRQLHYLNRNIHPSPYDCHHKIIIGVLSNTNKMVRAIWLAGTFAFVAQARAQGTGQATISFDTAPRVIDDLGTQLSVIPDTLLEDSPLLNLTGLEKRKKIDLIVAVATVVGSTASVVIAANAGTDIYEYIAQKIKDKSDRNSCTLTYGTDSDDGSYEGYAFQATTTGSNCDTTAIYQTILNAVEDCANKLHNARSVRGCCKSSHGGTWTGHLRLTADPDQFLPF